MKEGNLRVPIENYGGNDYNNSRLFTGREYDRESGLYYLRARYYDSELGRFISRDPIGMADDVNLYSYVGNSPVMKVDLLGLWDMSVSGIKNTFKAGADGLYNIGSYAIDGIKCPFKQIVNGAIYGDMLENPTGWNMLGQIGIGFTPAGWVGDIRDVGYQVSQGNYGMALVNGIGFIPGVGDGLVRVVKGPMKKVGVTVGDAISGMSDSVVKTLRETNESINNIDLSFVFATVDGAPLRVGNLTSNFKNNVSSFLESTKNSLSKVQNFSSSGGKGIKNPIVGNITKLSNDDLISPVIRGNAPISKIDGKPIEIHHKGQNPNGPFEEKHASNHRMGENYKLNHPDYNKSTNIDRNEFNKFKKSYWEGEWDSGRFN